ncbi:hypothetical protein OG422_11000 [Streptomyces sp. NBC_01525]|uniref:hypothetical protein n=1 Tax=Streptomyces sp. NBC_01525 TaxID=2903893 RepID=UPI00386C2D92
MTAHRSGPPAARVRPRVAPRDPARRHGGWTPWLYLAPALAVLGALLSTASGRRSASSCC